jgi:hypothetical protein
MYLPWGVSLGGALDTEEHGRVSLASVSRFATILKIPEVSSKGWIVRIDVGLSITFLLSPWTAIILGFPRYLCLLIVCRMPLDPTSPC